MSDVAVSLERLVDAPADALWRVLTDVEGLEGVLSGVTRVERLAGIGYAIGTRWRVTRAMLGRETSEELEVVGIDEGRSTTLAAEASGIVTRTELTLEPVTDAAGQTIVRMRRSGTFLSPSWLQRAVATLTWGIGLRATRAAMRQDLDDIAAAAESR